MASPAQLCVLGMARELETDQKKCSSLCTSGRMRWLKKDLFNSLKHRGFNIKHDYSRDPSAQIIWVLLIMLAFLVTELFVITRQIIPLKRNRSLKDFMRSIFYELRHLYNEIFKASIFQRKIQFRYCFEKAYFSFSNC